MTLYVTDIEKCTPALKQKEAMSFLDVCYNGFAERRKQRYLHHTYLSVLLLDFYNIFIYFVVYTCLLFTVNIFINEEYFLYTSIT